MIRYKVNIYILLLSSKVSNICCKCRIIAYKLCPYSIIKAATAYDEKKLSGFADDGLIYYTDDYLEMTTAGSAFVRNVAASLDKLMLHSPHSYSKPL